MRKRIAVCAVIALLLMLAGCGKSAAPTERVLDAKICAIEEDVYRVEPCDGGGEMLEIPAELYWKSTDDPSGRAHAVGVGDILRITFQGENITAIEAQTVNGVAVLLEPMVMVDHRLYVYSGEKSTAEGQAEGEITSQVPQSQEPTENGQSNFGTGVAYRHVEEGTVEVCVEDTWWVFETKEHRASKEAAVAEAEKNAQKLLDDLDALTPAVMGKSAEEVHTLLGDPVGFWNDPDTGKQYEMYLAPKESGDEEIHIGYDENGMVDTVTKG